MRASRADIGASGLCCDGGFHAPLGRRGLLRGAGAAVLVAGIIHQVG
jgi:hypothetical protein